MAAVLEERRGVSLDSGGRRVSPDPLTKQIQSRVIAHLHPKKRMSDELIAQLREALAKAVTDILSNMDEETHLLRMALVQHVAQAEMGTYRESADNKSANRNNEDELISTTKAAEILGYSRPYVAMLIDEGKLKGVTRSEGGHRRVSKTSVMEWKRRAEDENKNDDYRKAAVDAGMYDIDESEYAKITRKRRS